MKKILRNSREQRAATCKKEVTEGDAVKTETTKLRKLRNTAPQLKERDQKWNSIQYLTRT